MNTLSHNLVMRHDSWHARWYRHWVSLGGTSAAYKENFCRYVRILLIWAPLRWFFKGRIKRVPPWTITLITGIFAFIGIAFYLWPNVSLKVLEIIGISIGVIAGLILLIAGGSYIYDQDEDRAIKLAKWMTSPIWILPYLILSALIWVWDKYEDQFRAFWKFLERRVCFGLHPIAVFYMMCFLAGLAIFFYQDPVKTAIVIGCIIGALILLVAGIIVVEEIKERRNVGKPKTWLGRAYEGTTDTVKLAYTFVGSKKTGSRICPFIEFEEAKSA